MAELTPVLQSLWERFSDFLTAKRMHPELGFQPQGEPVAKLPDGSPAPVAYLMLGQADTPFFTRTIGDKNADQYQLLDFTVLVTAADYVMLIRAIDVCNAALMDFAPDGGGPIDQSGGFQSRLPVDSFLTPYSYAQTLGYICPIGLEVST